MPLSGKEFQILGAAILNALTSMLVYAQDCAQNCCPSPCERSSQVGRYGFIRLAV